MGLDVYVGPLSRYYAGDWETIVQQYGRESGVSVRVVRPPSPKQSLIGRLLDCLRPRGPAAAQRAVRRWRNRLGKELGIADLDWNEYPNAEYATDKPAWDCYGGLVLWAAYDELPDAKRRETAKGWDEDSAYLTSRMNPRSRYRHLLADTEIWLPVEFGIPFRTAAITGNEVVVGSSVRLLAELRELNSRTWKADDQQIHQWRVDGADYGAPLETSARLAFSIFYTLGQRSVAARLPMKLDY
jgi:hypothetical protein